MVVNVLIATIDSGIEKVENILLGPRPDIRYIVSHQVTEERFRPLPAGLNREDVVVGQIGGRGLSRNRNNALAMADGDIAILADDDVRYRPEHFQAAQDAFKADRDLEVACFKIATPGGRPDYKEYFGTAYLLNEEEHHYISSLEIAFRLDAIRSKGITFDERFGMGSELISYGEEAVFIYDCIRAGLKVKYIPEDVVEHSAASTIKTMAAYDSAKNIFKGAYDARRYGWLAYPAAFFGMLRLWPELKRLRKSPRQYLGERLRGAAHIYRQTGNPGRGGSDRFPAGE